VASVIELDPSDHQNHAWLANDYGALGAFDAALYHARMCVKLKPEAATCAYFLAHVEMLSGDLAAARRAVLEATTRDPRNSQVLLAQEELQYFTGDCAGALRSIAQARPEYAEAEAALDLVHTSYDVAIVAWCLRQRGETARVALLSRVFNTQWAPPLAPGMMEDGFARMAAAMGDRNALVTHLTALTNSRNPALVFTRHEPMIQPYLKDPAVVALLDKLDARRAELRGVLPKASTHVPVPGVPEHAGS
jgi:tetratricopeptide (TPR) repeat protein